MRLDHEQSQDEHADRAGQSRALSDVHRVSHSDTGNHNHSTGNRAHRTTQGTGQEGLGTQGLDFPTEFRSMRRDSFVEGHRSGVAGTRDRTHDPRTVSATSAS